MLHQDSFTDLHQSFVIRAGESGGFRFSLFSYEPLHEKPVFGVCDQVRHKPACTAKEAR